MFKYHKRQIRYYKPDGGVSNKKCMKSSSIFCSLDVDKTGSETRSLGRSAAVVEDLVSSCALISSLAACKRRDKAVSALISSSGVKGRTRDGGSSSGEEA